MAENLPPAGGSPLPASSLNRGQSSLVWWGHLANYLMLGGAAVIIGVEIMESGGWRRLGMPLLFISLAIVNLTVMHARARRRAESD